MAKKKKKAKKTTSSAVSSKPRINGMKKGKQFERDISNALGHIFPNAERMLEYQASGNIGVDIKGTGCFKIQCKRNAAYASIGKIHEVRTEDPNDIPVLVTKGNHLPAMAVLPFEALVRMMEVMHGLSPLLRKPEDTATKAIEDKSEHVKDYVEATEEGFKAVTKLEALANNRQIPIDQKANIVQRILFPPIVVKKEDLKHVDIKAGAITYEKIFATEKDIMEHKITPLKKTYLGLPLSSDSLYSEGELVFDLKNGATEYCDFGEEVGNENPEAYIMHKLNKLVSSGKIVTGIRCHSAEDLHLQALAVPKNFRYPVETAKVVEVEVKPKTLDLSTLI